MQLPNGSFIKPQGAGRKVGQKNKKTLALNALMDEKIKRLEELEKKPYEGDALALLQSIYKDQSLDINTRADAAKNALKFEKPALASIEQNVRGEIGLYKAIPVFERDSITIANVAQELIED